MGWQENAIMYWSDDAGATWNKITDHNRAPLQISIERIERANRMANGTLRRHVVGKKRVITASWSMLPSKTTSSYGGRQGLGTVDGGWAGEDIETFHNDTDGAFRVRLRKGTDESSDISAVGEEYEVMVTDFSKDIEKRGVVDFWSLSITLEEV